MDKTYNHTITEENIYKKWEATGAFQPNDDPKAKPFTIIMPPPNANDPLHIGHAMFITVEDILIRYHRMKGDAALWLPGTDHAGIETQFVYEKKLKKEGKSRFDFDRQTLFENIWKYVQENSGIAVNQMKKLGASADWSRFKFTLDPDIVGIVLHTFKKMHEQGLVYRDYRLINYCTRCGTGYSELEVKHELRRDPFIFIKYGPFVIGTVRPETKFRDTALAVNPNDKRYKKHIGESYEIPGLLGSINMKVIADPDVDPEFGTGIMKVTPAHDFHDYELGQKYNLPITPIIDFKGKMDFSWFLSKKDIPEKYRERAEQYHNLHVSKARPLMIQHLKDDGLLDRIDDKYEHTVSVCYRCGSLLEPLPLPQFFVKVKPLIEPVLKALKTKKVKIHGPGYDKILRHWLKNLKDWNISRQIVWGIRMPIWYSATHNPNIEVSFICVIPAQAGIQTNIDSRFRGNDNSAKFVQGKIGDLIKQGYTLSQIKSGLQQLKAPMGAEYVISKTSPGKEYLQETDTFDTWFSSGQWPFATLMSSSKSKIKNQKSKINEETQNSDFKRFYPTQVMETAYDILIMWVMRMLMFGLYETGQVPFEHVYLHGLVRDEKGLKMSKSKGNVINPLDIISKYGADALRMALVMSTTAGRDSSTGEGKIRGMRNFTNKIWNATRFIKMMNESEKPSPIPEIEKNDALFKQKLKLVAESVTKQLDDLKVGLAGETVYNEFWHWFCDESIERCKKGELSLPAVSNGLKVFLTLLHPFVPFVTEEAWSKLEKKLLITNVWPY